MQSEEFDDPGSPYHRHRAPTPLAAAVPGGHANPTMDSPTSKRGRRPQPRSQQPHHALQAAEAVPLPPSGSSSFVNHVATATPSSSLAQTADVTASLGSLKGTTAGMHRGAALPTLPPHGSASVPALAPVTSDHLASLVVAGGGAAAVAVKPVTRLQPAVVPTRALDDAPTLPPSGSASQPVAVSPMARQRATTGSEAEDRQVLPTHVSRPQDDPAGRDGAARWPPGAVLPQPALPADSATHAWPSVAAPLSSTQSTAGPFGAVAGPSPRRVTAAPAPGPVTAPPGGSAVHVLEARQPPQRPPSPPPLATMGRSVTSVAVRVPAAGSASVVPPAVPPVARSSRPGAEQVRVVHAGAAPSKSGGGRGAAGDVVHGTSSTTVVGSDSYDNGDGDDEADGDVDNGGYDSDTGYGHDSAAADATPAAWVVNADTVESAVTGGAADVGVRPPLLPQLRQALDVVALPSVGVPSTTRQPRVPASDDTVLSPGATSWAGSADDDDDSARGVASRWLSPARPPFHYNGGGGVGGGGDGSTGHAGAMGGPPFPPHHHHRRSSDGMALDSGVHSFAPPFMPSHTPAYSSAVDGAGAGTTSTPTLAVEPASVPRAVVTQAGAFDGVTADAALVSVGAADTDAVLQFEVARSARARPVESVAEVCASPVVAFETWARAVASSTFASASVLRGGAVAAATRVPSSVHDVVQQAKMFVESEKRRQFGRSALR